MNRSVLLLIFLLSVQIFIQSCGLSAPDPNFGMILGLVKDTNGFVLPDTRVGIVGMDKETKTDRNGKFFMSVIPVGTVTVVATRGELSVTSRVKVEKDQTTDNVILIFSEADKIAPSLAKVAATGITDNRAVIGWITDELATSQVDYGITPLYGSSTVEITELVTSHTVSLTNLMASTLYHFRVKSKDRAGNLVTSGDFLFTTTAGSPPGIPQGLAIADPATPGLLNLTWSQNSEADFASYEVHRSLEPDRDFVLIKNTGKANAMADTGLTIGEKYYYKIRAKDTGGSASDFSPTQAKVVTGSLSANVTWKPSKNPYLLSGDILVDIGKILTLQPGTEVRSALTDVYRNSLGVAGKVDLIVRGAMNARGTVTSPILFTTISDVPKVDDWQGLKFLGATDALNALDYCTISFCVEAIFSDASTLQFNRNRIGYSTVGINSRFSPNVTIAQNYLHNVGIGIFSSRNLVLNNIIEDAVFGIVVNGDDRIENNTIDANTGIQVNVGNPTIKNNILAFNTFGYFASGTLGIGPGPNGIQSGTVIYNNIFGYNIPLGPGYDIPVPTGTLFLNPRFRGDTAEPFRLQKVSEGYATDSLLLTAGENGVQMGRYGP